MPADVLQMLIVLAILLLLVRPVGTYMAAVFTRKPSAVDRVFDPIDNGIYRLSGVNPNENQRWPAYVKAMLITNFAMWAILFVILEVPQDLPLNPDGQGPVNPWLAFNTSLSFVTNTNWQNYGGENTLSYFTQMFAIIFPQFTSAATGLACGIAFIRGLGGSVGLGNFYVDMTRAITRIMLPLSFVAALAFVALGVPATFDGALTVTTLNHGQQTIPLGPVAALEAIKHLGTNGGGWFNANSAHPFENPNPISNILENVLMALLPMGIIVALGIMLNRMKQAWTFFYVMGGFFLAFLAIAFIGETQGNPLLTALGLNPAQGNMEGHELRFGQGLTALFVTSTTAFTTGTIDAMHDSLTPLASITPLSQMLLNMVFGGKGVGFMLALAGSMAAKKEVPMTVGTMKTDGRLFGGVLAGTVLIIGALTFFPVLALGPLAEHFAMWAGQTFS